MEKFLLENSTEEQEWILNLQFRWIPYSRICQEWPFARTDGTGNKIGLTNQNIIARIRRSSLWHSCSNGTKGENGQHLWYEDMRNLRLLIISTAKDSSPLDTSLVIYKALETEFYCTTAATRLYLQPHNTNKQFFLLKLVQFATPPASRMIIFISAAVLSGVFPYLKQYLK